MDLVGQTVVQVRESDSVLSSYWLANNDLVDVVEFIPIIIPAKEIISIDRNNKSINKTRENNRSLNLGIIIKVWEVIKDGGRVLKLV